MKRILLLLVLLAGFSVSGFCQTKSTNGGASFGLESGVPLGDFSNYHNVVLGASLKFAIPVSTKSAVTFSLGYSSFLAKPERVYAVSSGSSSTSGGVTSTNSYEADNYIPLKIGYKYNFAGNFYGEGQVGYAINTGSSDFTAFAWSPGIGYDFGGKADIGLRYEAWSNKGTLSQVALRLAIGFK